MPCQVVVGAELDGRRPVPGLTDEGDDREVRIETRFDPVGLADHPDDLEAGHVRQVESEDQDVRAVVSTEPKCVGARRRGQDLEVVRGEVVGERFEGALVSVADDDRRDLFYPRHRRSPPSGSGCLAPCLGIGRPPRVQGSPSPQGRATRNRVGCAFGTPAGWLPTNYRRGPLAMLRRDRSSDGATKRVGIGTESAHIAAYPRDFGHWCPNRGGIRRSVRNGPAEAYPLICRVFEAMELGGFEPPTSWVRSNVSSSTGPHSNRILARNAVPLPTPFGMADSRGLLPIIGDCGTQKRECRLSCLGGSNANVDRRLSTTIEGKSSPETALAVGGRMFERFGETANLVPSQSRAHRRGFPACAMVRPGTHPPSRSSSPP